MNTVIRNETGQLGTEAAGILDVTEWKLAFVTKKGARDYRSVSVFFFLILKALGQRHLGCLACRRLACG